MALRARHTQTRITPPRQFAPSWYRQPPQRAGTTPGYTPPPGGEGPIPPGIDPVLEARRATAQARRTTLSSDADVDLQQTSQEYGFKYDPATGTFGGFDPTNPFSQAALLARTRDESTKVSELGYQRAQRGSQQSYASAGQLYSGAYESAQAEDTRVVGERRKAIQFNYEKGYDTLRRGYEDYVKRYLRRKRDIESVSPEEVASLS